MRKEIEKLKPDFIYVHLGVNDVSQEIPLRYTMANFLDFKAHFTDFLLGTQVVISLPLFTNDPEMNKKIWELRNGLDVFVDHFKEDRQPLKSKKLWMNQNINFTSRANQASWTNLIIWDNHSTDGIHLSERGKHLILGNLRSHIHQMTKLHQDKVVRRPTGLGAK